MPTANHLAGDLADSTRPSDTFRDSVFEEFGKLVRGTRERRGRCRGAQEQDRTGLDMGAERDASFAFRSHALSSAQCRWGDESKSLESFTASPATAEVAVEESGVWRQL